MQTGDTVMKLSLPYAYCGSFKMFCISASKYRSVGMRRRMRACADGFLAIVTEGVVHGEYKVVTRSSLGVTWRHIWRVEVKVLFGHRINTTCSVNDSPNLRRYVASLGDGSAAK